MAGTLVQLVNVGSVNGCMDLTSYAAGTPVTLYKCNGSVDSQVFEYGDNSFRSKISRLCMDVSSYTVGAVVHMEVCHGGTSQKWRHADDDTIYSLGNASLCMDLRSYNNGTPLTLEWCGSQRSQKWQALT
ncbi:RICIN domain-containing protein [Lentzea sp. NPDC004782]|uniref:RICIN domain-containing protein n=1 Tax=Lentzea sp. NPDC004782 TaxID=3154458 RepID=UPI0033BA8BA6